MAATAVEKVLRETIAAKDETIATQKDTIAALRGVIELYRAGGFASGNAPISAPVEVAQILEPTRLERMWMDDDEEEIAALIESGELTGSAAEQALAQIQATHPPLAIVK